MKQLDTIRNHEWIPTELDLENMPRVTQHLPTASAENVGIVYLLDGVHEGYVKSHFYKCTKDSDGNYYWSDLHVGRFTVGNCKNIQLAMFDDGEVFRVIMAWEDPDDVVVGSEVTRWKKTVLVHQVGHMPMTVTDGSILCTNETRNAYSRFGTFSITIADTGSRKHYFKLFPYSDDDAITNDDQNGRVAGYNYQITTDTHPYSLDASGNVVYRYAEGSDTKSVYYSRTLNQTTGLYEYTQLDFNSTNFTVTSEGRYEFNAAKAYYTYQNCLINWAGIQQLVKNGTAEDYFPIGTILMLPYHGDYGQMAFEVVDFDNVEAYDPNIKFTMTLQAKYLYSWWDLYDVGYVFDAEEKAGAKTTDSAPVSNKPYHYRWVSTASPTLKGSGVNTPSTDTPATIAGTIRATEGEYVLYPESHWDSGGLPVPYSDYGWTDSKTKTATQVTQVNFGSELRECELSYTTPHYAGMFLAATTSLYGGTDASSTTTIASASNNQELYCLPKYPPSDFIDLRTDDARWRMTSDTNYRYGKAYATVAVYRNTTHHKYALTMVNHDGAKGIEAINVTAPTASADTTPVAGKVYFKKAGSIYILSDELKLTDNPHTLGLYEKSAANVVIETYSRMYSFVYQYTSAGNTDVVHTNSSIAANMKSDSNKYNIVDAKSAYIGWGGGHSCFQKAFLPNFNPRNNVYADMFIRVPYASSGQIVRSYNASVAYYIPVELDFRLTRTGSKANAQTYAWNRYMCLREASSEIASFMKYILLKTKDTTIMVHGHTYPTTTFLVPTKETSSSLVSGRTYYTRKSNGEYKQVDSPDVSQIGTYYYYPAGTESIDLNAVCRRAVLIPTQDIKFLPGKQYFRAVYKPLVSGGNWTNTNSWFAVKESATIGSNGHTTTVEWYRRVHGKSGTISPEDAATYYEIEFVPLEEDLDAIKHYKHGISPNDADVGIASGTKFSAGDIIPCRTLTPLYCVDMNHYGEYTTPSREFATSTTGYYERTGSEGDYTYTPVTTTLNQDVTGLFVKYEKNCPDPKCYIWSIDGGWTECPVDLRGRATSNDDAEGGVGYSGYPVANLRVTDIYQGSISSYTNAAHTTTYEEVQLYWKMPNTERVKYGNHVWCQSNIRSYLNGPFDTSVEYVPTHDTTFVTTHTYFRFVSGSGYVRLIQGSAASASQFVAGNSIADWSSTYGSPVYVRMQSGIPVGVKLDINQPEKYWNYGVSPVMQYEYNGNSWQKAYNDTDPWWEARPSVNNGLVYDRLASMYYHIYVTDKSSDSIPQLSTASFTAKHGAGWSTTPVSAVRDKDDKPTKVKTPSSTTPVDFTAKHMCPRQSFLHGFIDCRYKRTSDTAILKDTYYVRTILGQYRPVDSKSIAESNPYKNGLYEENTSYRDDIRDAYDFLNAIVPVINRNGLYGTIGAYDFYPRAGNGSVNIGGTTCVDKVWLASTNQVAGGASANNNVWEEWSGGANGKWNSLDIGTQNRYPGVGSATGGNMKYALKKYSMCCNYARVFGYVDINGSRVKSSITLGRHIASGYSDSGLTTQYWWLRSAGGTGTSGRNERAFRAALLEHVRPWDGYSRDDFALAYMNPDVNQRLSPLITIG